MLTRALSQQQYLSIRRPSQTLESVQIDTTRQLPSRVVGSIPPGGVLPGGHASVHQQTHALTQNIVDSNPHVGVTGRFITDECCAVEWIGIAQSQMESRR